MNKIDLLHSMAVLMYGSKNFNMKENSQTSKLAMIVFILSLMAAIFSDCSGQSYHYYSHLDTTEMKIEESLSTFIIEDSLIILNMGFQYVETKVDTIIPLSDYRKLYRTFTGDFIITFYHDIAYIIKWDYDNKLITFFN